MKNVLMLWARIIFVNKIFALFSYMSVFYILAPSICNMRCTYAVFYGPIHYTKVVLL